MKPIYEKLIGCPDEGFLFQSCTLGKNKRFIVKEIRGKACHPRKVVSASIVLQIAYTNRNAVAQSLRNQDKRRV